MSTIMIVLLCIDAVLLAALFAYVVVAILNKDKEVAVTEEKAPEIKEEAKVEEKEEVKEPVVEQTEEPAKELVAEEPVAEPAVAVALDEDVEDAEDDRYIEKRISFAEKMLTLDAKTQIYYEKIHNAFKALRKINPRISMKGVSYRLGRELVAKISVRGKTMRLHLALNLNDFAQNIYFQKDMSDVKAYEEVPFMVKVKSDRGLKKALELVEALCQAKAIEKKSRFVPIDAIAELKEKI